jgi:hypothetical protein
VPLPDVPCPASQFFSVVRPSKVEAPEVRHVPRFVPASVVPCIQRARLQPERVRSASAQRFRLRAQLAPAAVLAVQPGVPVSAMFRAA